MAESSWRGDLAQRCGNGSGPSPRTLGAGLGAASRRFWRKLHNTVTYPYKVERGASVGARAASSGPDCLDEVEERRRERSCRT